MLEDDLIDHSRNNGRRKMLEGARISDFLEGLEDDIIYQGLIGALNFALTSHLRKGDQDLELTTRSNFELGHLMDGSSLLLEMDRLGDDLKIACGEANFEVFFEELEGCRDDDDGINILDKLPSEWN